MSDSSARPASLVDLPLMPCDDDGPVFAEPWQAQAFAAVVELIESETVTRDEWAERLGATLKEAEARGEVDTGTRYYDHWLDTLEKLVLDKGLAGPEDLDREREEIEANDHHRREHQLGHEH